MRESTSEVHYFSHSSDLVCSILFFFTCSVLKYTFFCYVLLLHSKSHGWELFASDAPRLSTESFYFRSNLSLLIMFELVNKAYAIFFFLSQNQWRIMVGLKTEVKNIT